MANLPSVRDKMLEEETDFESPVSEQMLQKVGSNINNEIDVNDTQDGRLDALEAALPISQTGPITFSTTSATFVDITGMTVALTSGSSVVDLIIQPYSGLMGEFGSTGGDVLEFQFLRDATVVGGMRINGQTTGSYVVDVGAVVGPQNYKVQARRVSGTGTGFLVTNMQLIARQKKL